MEDWFSKFEKEIGSDRFNHFHDVIEDLSWTIEDNIIPPQRSLFVPRYECSIDAFSYHFVENESLCNEQILHDLNHGANRILLTWNDLPRLDIVLKEVLFEYVRVNLCVRNEKDLASVLSWYHRVHATNIIIETQFDSMQSTAAPCVRKISGFDVYAVGGNGIQEISFIILELNRILRLTSTETIIIEIGIGENMIIETAKIIALKWLIEASSQRHKAKTNITVRAKIGWRNKVTSSHTNQIKQTTEALTALIGGVHELCITPYDHCYAKPSEIFVRRMAINTAHILREEAHLNRFPAIDKGSIAILNLAQKFADQCWGNFTRLNDHNAPEEVLKSMIVNTLNIRNTQVKNVASLTNTPEYGFGNLPFYFFESL